MSKRGEEQFKRTKQVIEENRLKRKKERLRVYNSPEQVKRRVEISRQIDVWIEDHSKKIPTPKQVELVISEIFRDYPKVLNSYVNGDKKVVGWMIGKIRNVLPEVEYIQIIDILRKR